MRLSGILAGLMPTARQRYSENNAHRSKSNQKQWASRRLYSRGRGNAKEQTQRAIAAHKASIERAGGNPNALHDCHTNYRTPGYTGPVQINPRSRKGAEALRRIRLYPVCPYLDCRDGMIPIEVIRTRTVPECCGQFNRDGSCCGNAVPAPEQYPDIDFVPCGWAGHQK